jgi:hypothetical protein
MLLQELKEQSYQLSSSDRLELISMIAESLRKSQDISADFQPQIIQTQRPAFGVMRGSGEILGDICSSII